MNIDPMLIRIAMETATRHAQAFADANGMKMDDGGVAVMTMEQAEREYGTPTKDPEPWLIPALKEFHGR